MSDDPAAQFWTPRLAAQGSVPIARAFLEAYPRLQLTASEALLVLFLVAFKGAREHADTSLAHLSRCLGVDARTVRSWASRLEGRGLLQRVLRRRGYGREQTNLWDLSPLFRALERFEPRLEISGHAPPVRP